MQRLKISLQIYDTTLLCSVDDVNGFDNSYEYYAKNDYRLFYGKRADTIYIDGLELFASIRKDCYTFAEQKDIKSYCLEMFEALLEFFDKCDSISGVKNIVNYKDNSLFYNILNDTPKQWHTFEFTRNDRISEMPDEIKSEKIHVTKKATGKRIKNAYKEYCKNCGSKLSEDGSCEKCWLKNCNDRIEEDIKSTNEAIKQDDDDFNIKEVGNFDIVPYYTINKLVKCIKNLNEQLKILEDNKNTQIVLKEKNPKIVLNDYFILQNENEKLKKKISKLEKESKK